MLTREAAAAAAPARTGRVTVRPATPADREAILAFTRRYYGPGANQASAERLDWLFGHNPHTQGLARDLLLAVHETEVVGSHWKMRLPWKIDGPRAIVPSPHDLALDEGYRQAPGAAGAVPPGLQLAAGVLSREPYAALLGLSPDSESIYSRLQCQKVPMVRMQKILSHARVAIGVAASKLGLDRAGAACGTEWDWKAGGRAISLVSSPSEEQLRDALALPYHSACHPDWDVATYQWRFFHSSGPRHLLLTLREAGSAVARAVFSRGLRHGAPMARIVDAAVATPSLYPALLAAAEEGMRRVGIAVATVATTCVPAHTYLAGRGWKVQSGVESRFHVRPVRPLDLSDIWGGAYDYGFDAAARGISGSSR